MSIKIKCPGCGSAVRVAEKYAGRQVKCPACEGPIVVPATPTQDAGSNARPRAAPPLRAASKVPEGPMSDRTKRLPAGMPPLPPPEESLDDFHDLSDERDDLPKLPARAGAASKDSQPAVNRPKRGTESVPDKRRVPEADDHYQNDRPPRVVVVAPTKSVGISLILTFFFGPLGMFYSTVPGGLIMMVVNAPIVIFGLCSGGVGLLLLVFTQPICMVWGAMAASSYNRKLSRGTRQY